MNKARLTIGEVAQMVGLKTSTIRYYESIGVLPEPERDSGQRRYNEQTVRQLQVIGIAKRAGLSLSEARALLRAGSEGPPACEQLRELANRKLSEIDAFIVRAQSMREWLSAATGCGCETLDVCALFDAGAQAPASMLPAAPLR
jgi:MerR family transcriptional regulator, redox-sensitive transcriptional activator SoxR